MVHHGGIYVIHCVMTDEYYVGRTKNSFEARFSSHKSQLALGVHHAPNLQKRYDTYGPSGLKYVILKRLPAKLIARYEQDAIRQLKPTLNGYGAKTAAVAWLAHTSGVDRDTIRARMKRGLTGDALIQKRYGSKRRAEVRGELLYPYEIAEKYGLPLALVKGRFYAGLQGEALIRPRHVRV